MFEIWELSDPPIDSKGPYTIKAQKRSKNIGKIIHVTSGVKLREYFLCKKKQQKKPHFIQICLRVTLAPFWRISAG